VVGVYVTADDSYNRYNYYPTVILKSGDPEYGDAIVVFDAQLTGVQIAKLMPLNDDYGALSIHPDDHMLIYQPNKDQLSLLSLPVRDNSIVFVESVLFE
jgi:hypothetical protein